MAVKPGCSGFLWGDFRWRLGGQGMVLGRISQVWRSRNCLILEGPSITSQAYKQYYAATPIFLRLQQASRKKKKKSHIGAASLGGETVWTIVQGKAAWHIQMEIALRCKLKLFLFSVDNPLSCLDLASWTCSHFHVRATSTGWWIELVSFTKAQVWLFNICIAIEGLMGMIKEQKF